jgi:hypothetical protein
LGFGVDDERVPCFPSAARLRTSWEIKSRCRES